MDNKKKLVFGALGVALLGVGAFQFVGGSKDSPTATAAEPKIDVSKALAQLRPSVPPLSPRDPFAPGKLPGAAEPEQRPSEPAKGTGGSKPSMGGSQPPINWGDQLPQLGGSQTTEAVPVTPQAPVFPYTLIGVVAGDTPAAVFTDTAGNQRLVTQGGSLDGDSKVVSIERGKVKIQFGKETLTLTIGGTASAK